MKTHHHLPTYSTVISAQQLQAWQNEKLPLIIFDCSFDLAHPNAGYEHYQTERIAGAIYAHLDHDLSAYGQANAASGGRHPLPARESVAAWLSRVGMTNDMQAVIYDRNNTMIAGRLWWLLQWLGHERAAVLDGGLQAWKASQGAIHTDLEPLQPAHQATHQTARAFQLHAPRVTLADAQTISKHIGSPTHRLLDARATARFTGEIEPLDPAAGHIPSALNRPFTNNFDNTGCFQSPEKLRKDFDQLLAGSDPAQTIHYCGSGVSAVPNILALALAGYGITTLYAGSWSDWSQDPTRPVAKG